VWSGIATAFSVDLVTYYNHAIPDLKAVFHSSPSVLVLSAIERGEADVGFTQADLAYRAYSAGIGDPAHARPLTRIRGMAVLWVNDVFIMVRRDSPYLRIGDLRGKRVGILPRDTAGEFVTPIVLSADGMTYADVRPTFVTAADGFAALRRGTLDAFIQVSPTFTAPMLNLDREPGVRVLPFSREELDRLRVAYPFLKRMVLTSRDLPSLEKDLVTVGVDAVLVCRDDLDEQLVYEMTRQLFAAVPQLTLAHPLAGSINEERASSAPIPLHPGAARYYREREILK
jgi:TRAP transporter TAXI family solute receptor